MTEGDAAAAAAESESVEEAEAKGYRGQADERDRDEYALTSGPESPSALETTLAGKKAEVDAQLDEHEQRSQDAGGSASAPARSERKAARQARKES